MLCSPLVLTTALPACSNGLAWIHFDPSAPSLEEAIHSAIAEVRAAGVGRLQGRVGRGFGGGRDLRRSRLQSQLGPRTRVVSRPAGHVQLRPRPARVRAQPQESGLGVGFVGFDLRGPETPAVTPCPTAAVGDPFLDRRVREAVALAVGPALRSSQAMYGGDAVVAAQFVPGVVFGFDRGVPAPVPRPSAAARQLLAWTPFARGLRGAPGRAQHHGALRRALRASLAGAGITVKPELLEDESLPPVVENILALRAALVLPQR